MTLRSKHGGTHPPTVLRIRCAMPGTDTSSYAISGTVIRACYDPTRENGMLWQEMHSLLSNQRSPYAIAMQRPVLSYGILRTPHAMSGPEIAYGLCDVQF
eukprot:3933020-Rhodomonas_salina.3